jgi:uncharacterized phage-associated protein
MSKTFQIYKGTIMKTLLKKTIKRILLFSKSTENYEEEGLNDAIEVANTLIGFADQNGDKINGPKLQKLLYYVEGWNLYFFDRSAFKQRIAMTRFGPVVKDVYRECMEYGVESLNEKVLGEHKSFQERGRFKNVYGGLNPGSVKKVTKRVYDAYGGFSNKRLMGMIVLNPETPHDEDRVKTGGILNCISYYSPQEMERYFEDLYNSTERSGDNLEQ